ncbi:hypothetical protein U1Q18_039646 [Sarracenia purpurea var. burkii]
MFLAIRCSTEDNFKVDLSQAVFDEDNPTLEDIEEVEVADIFTKPLCVFKFQYLQHKLLGCSIHPNNFRGPDRSIGSDKQVEDVSTHSGNVSTHSSDKEVGDVSTRSGNVSTHSSVHTPAEVTAEIAIPVLAPMCMLAQATTMHKPVIT